MSDLTEVVERLRQSQRVTVLTGAGVSAASGVPTFRGASGLWRNYKPEELATPSAFSRNPSIVWEWYNWRRQLIAACRPNASHDVLARWSRRFREFTLITQNVDGLHERADTRNVVRFHGSIWEVLCWNRCGTAPGRWWDERVPLPELPPKCPGCDGLLRPGVVWFGEGIDPDVVRRSTAALDCDVFFTIGTSAVVYPAAGLVDGARARGALTVEINPEATPAASRVDQVISEPAEVALPRLESALG